MPSASYPSATTPSGGPRLSLHPSLHPSLHRRRRGRPRRRHRRPHQRLHRRGAAVSRPSISPSRPPRMETDERQYRFRAPSDRNGATPHRPWRTLGGIAVRHRHVRPRLPGDRHLVPNLGSVRPTVPDGLPRRARRRSGRARPGQRRDGATTPAPGRFRHVHGVVPGLRARPVHRRVRHRPIAARDHAAVRGSSSDGRSSATGSPAPTQHANSPR